MNIKKRLAISFFVMLTLAGSAFATDIIRLSLPLYPPFVQEENGIPAGIGVDFVTKVLAEVGLKYTYELAPNYGRAVADTKLSNVDGFFWQRAMPSGMRSLFFPPLWLPTSGAGSSRQTRSSTPKIQNSNRR